jgi:GxxExxY protein
MGVFSDGCNELEAGFLESTDAGAMLSALALSGRGAVQEVPVPLWLRGKKAGHHFADILPDNRVLPETKASPGLEPAPQARLSHSPRATEIEVGLLLNFGQPPQFRRLLCDKQRKQIGENPCNSLGRASA